MVKIQNSPAALTSAQIHTRVCVSDGLKPGLLSLLGEIRWEILREENAVVAGHIIYSLHITLQLFSIQHTVEGKVPAQKTLKQEPL